MGLIHWLTGDTAPVLRQPTARADVDLLEPEAMAEYRSVAASVGVSAHGLDIEEFRVFLSRSDLPIFSREDVVAYMDKIAATDNPMRFGWHWCPVRPKDAKVGYSWGKPSEHVQHTITNAGTSNTTFARVAGSDYYHDKTAPYKRIMPLHALKKIATIEQRFSPDQICFLVTDYVLHPHVITKTEQVIPAPLPPPPRINPDPFLMAVVPNPDVIYGVGAFIIDVWDEPGFGLERLVGLKS